MDEQNMQPAPSQGTGGSQAIKWIVGIVIVALVIWGLVAAHKKNTNQPAGQNQVASETYKIGVILPLTGDAASYGEGGRNIEQMAAEEINNSGGINGKKIELIIEDGKCDGQDGSSATQKLANVDKVQVIIGGFCSGESLAAVPIAETAKVALLSPASSSPKLTNISRYFARNYPSDSSQGSVLANVAYSQKAWKKIAVLQEQTDYAVGIYGAFSKQFQALGGNVTIEQFPTETTDFRSQLTKMEAEKSDAIFLDTQSPASAARILKQIQDMNWKPHILLSDVTPPDTQTVTTFKNLLEGALGAEFGVGNNNPKFEQFVSAYKQKYGTDVPYPAYGQTEYDAVYLVRDAILNVGYDGTKISDWFKTVKNWDGASGQVTIGADGDLVGGHKPVIITNGAMQPLAQ